MSMPRCFLPLLLLWSSVLPAASTVSAQQRIADFTQLEETVLEELKQTSTPGAAVAIISGERLVFAKGFGTANVETGVPVTPDMLFRVGSVTKMFTAAVLVSLAEDKQINLDEAIGKYAKGLHPKISRITAHQLMTHTAGLTDESPTDYGLHDDSALSAYVRSLNGDHFFTEADKIFSYSNPGFDVAGFLIEEVGGKPYADLMSERLFKPLGMNRTTFRPTVAMTYPLSQGHSASNEAKQTVIRPFGDNVAGWPDGFMFSSVHDLARFAIAFMNDGRIDGKEVLAPEMISKLSTPYVDIQSRFGFDNGKYGYGVFVHDPRGAPMIWHAGLIPGFGALFEMIPAHRFAVIVLANRSGSLLSRTAEKAMELMVPLDARRSKAEQPQSTNEVEIREFVGTYMNKPESVELVVRQGTVLIRREDGEFPVRRTGGNRFTVLRPGEAEAEEFVLLRDDHGKPAYLHIGRHALKMVRLRK
jgi:CubicO group peptidase (beta-lactamase class C family)